MNFWSQLRVQERQVDSPMDQFAIGGTQFTPEQQPGWQKRHLNPLSPQQITLEGGGLRVPVLGLWPWGRPEDS